MPRIAGFEDGHFNFESSLLLLGFGGVISIPALGSFCYLPLRKYMTKLWPLPQAACHCGGNTPCWHCWRTGVVLTPDFKNNNSRYYYYCYYYYQHGLDFSQFNRYPSTKGLKLRWSKKLQNRLTELMVMNTQSWELSSELWVSAVLCVSSRLLCSSLCYLF